MDTTESGPAGLTERQARALERLRLVVGDAIAKVDGNADRLADRLGTPANTRAERIIADCGGSKAKAVLSLVLYADAQDDALAGLIADVLTLLPLLDPPSTPHREGK